MASALERLRKARQGSGTSLASVNISTGTAGNGASGGSALARLRAARSGTGSSTSPAISNTAQTVNSGATGTSALARLRAARAAQAQAQLTPAARLYESEEEKNKQEERDNGGWLGGVGYVAEKAGLGFLQTFEGAVDWTTALVADLFGADDTAEWIMENDWVNYSHADEWFNPSEAWRVAGDVAGGIGTSLAGVGVGLAVSAIPGGAAVAPGLALGVMGLGAAGTSTKEAYMESGKLGLEEFAYGGAMGLVEAGTEWLSGGLGAGVTKAIGAFTKSAGKTATALTLKSFAKDMGKEFLSEAFEEGFSTWISPYVKRATYDPNAKNATAEEILYAGFVGGLSGLVMGGGRVGVTQIMNRADGSTAVKEGRVSSIMDTAKAFSDYEGAHPTKLSSMEAVRDLYTRLEAQGVREAAKLTGEQRRALGELQTLTTSAVFESPMQKSALSAIAGAEAIAEKLNADGNIKMVDGKMQSVTPESIAELQKKGAEVRGITAEDIRAGVDAKNGKSVAKAMQKNDLLRYIVASDVAGRFMMTANEVETAARAGTKIKSQTDLNAFIENATDEQKSALGKEFGIADNEWATMSLKRFNQAAAAYRESGKLEQRRAEMKAAEKNKNAYAGEAVGGENIRYTYEGKAADGKSIYKSNFPKGTPKKAKSERILNYITDVWSKKPISLVISNGETSRTIKAEFDPTIDETGNTPTDASKIAGGNRHGNGTEKRVTLDLADDYHQIVEESKYNYSKEETGKDNPAHEGVKLWHYFVDDIYFIEQENSEMVPYTVTINVKEKDNGEFVYSFNAEKTEESSTRQTLHAGVNTRKGANGELFIDSIPDSAEKSNSFEKNSQENAENSADFGKNAASSESSSEKSGANTESSSEKSSKEKISELKERINVKKIDAYCRENIEEYASMSAANQSMIRQVVREGRVYGLDDADILSYARVAARSGLNIVYDENLDAKGIAGEYAPKNNRIVVNPKAEKRQELILIHELDHTIRAYLGDDGKIHYIAYKDADKKVSKEKWEQIKKDYADQDIEVTREELFADEASAYYTEELIGTDKFIDLLLGKEPSLAKKILNFFTGAARAYSKDTKLSKEARRHYKNFKKMFDAFAEWNQGRNAETAVESVGDGKASRKTYASINAKTADKMQLSNAREMLKNGASSEEVRRETGWFKSYDGKWRFEINDADSHLIENPALEKHTDDGEVYFTGKLSDIFDHKALYESYPELKDINVVIQKTELGVDGIYQPNSNYITLSIEQFKRHTKAYHDYLDGGRKAEIKSIEASEAYKEYNRLYDDEVMDSMEPEKWLEAEKTAREKFYSSELGKRYYELMWGKDGFSSDKFEFGWAKPARETLLHELQHTVQNIEGLASGTNTRDPDYDRNAGEIEARDTARRANMTAEERKNTQPDVYQEGVVVIGVSEYAESIARTDKGVPVVVVNDDITRYASNDKALVKLVKKSIGKLPYVALGRQKIKFLNDTKREVTYSKYTRWLRKNVPDVYKDKMRLFGHPSEIILATTNYINEAPKHPRNDNIIDFARGEVLVDILGKKYKADVVIGFTSQGECELHDVENLTPTTFAYKKRDALSAISHSGEHSQKRSSLDISISQSAEKSTDSAKKVSENSDKISKSARKSGDFEAKLEEKSGTQQPLLGVFDKHGRKIEAVRSVAESRFRKEILDRFEYSNPGNVVTRDLIDYHLGKNAIAMLEAEPIEVESADGITEGTLKENASSAKLGGAAMNRDIGSVSVVPSRIKGYASRQLSARDAILFSSLKSIIENGRVVGFSHPDGVLFEEIRIAAPVKLGDELTYAEITVRRNDAGGTSYVYDVAASENIKKTLKEASGPAKSKRLSDKLGTAKPVGVLENSEAKEETSVLPAENEATNEQMLSPELYSVLRNSGGRLRITEAVYKRLVEGSDKATASKIKGRWGYSRGSKYKAVETLSVKDFVKEIAKFREIKALTEMNDAEALIEIDRLWRINKDGGKAYRLEKENELLKAWNKELHDKSRKNLESQVDYLARKLQEMKDATFFNASQYRTGELKSSILKLAGIKWRGKDSANHVRTLAKRFSEWYDPKQNEMLGYISDDNPGLYDADIKETIDELAKGDSEYLTNEELEDLIRVLEFAKTFAERFSKVYYDGKWIDSLPEAQRHVNAAKNSQSLNGRWATFKHAVFNFLKALGDPLSVVKMADRYNPDGFFTTFYERIERAEMKARVTEMETLGDFDKFFNKKENKGYAKKIMQEECEYLGHKLRKTQLVDLYMSLKSQTALPGLAFSGFEFTNKQGHEERVKGFVGSDAWSELWSTSESERADAWKKLNKLAAEQRSIIEKQLTAQDMEYISILEAGYLKTKALKDATDNIKFGYKRTKSGYYLPTVRANVAKSVQSLYTQVDLVNNISANKHTKEGTVSEIYIGDSTAKFKGHVNAISNYSNLSVEIDNYNKVFNLDVGDNPNKPTSVKTETVNAWRALGIVGKNGAKMTKEHGGSAYMMSIIDSITGTPQVKGAFNSFIGKVRGRYAQAVLGLNWKSWLSQMQSWIAASSEYSIGDMLKGVGLLRKGTFDDMDKYCSLAKLRNYDSSAAKAQGVLDEVKGIGAVTMKPTSLVDRFVCALDFCAAQVEVERTTGAKIGSEENLKAAGERLAEVILRTQQNTLASSKNAAARSGSEFAKSIVMFQSDAIKTTGRGIDSLGEYFTLLGERRAMKKSGATAEGLADIDKRISEAGKRAFKANFALVMGAFFAVGIGRLASLVFYGRDEEEEEQPLLSLTLEFIGNMLGGLPLIDDAWNRLVDGYEVSDSGYSAINDMLDSVDKVFDLAAKSAEGKMTSQESASALRDAVFAFSTLFGIPTKNIYKTGRGLIRIASPNTLYKLEGVTDIKNFASDFEEAINAGDEEKAAMILEMLLSERLYEVKGNSEDVIGAGHVSEAHRGEILRMKTAGYNILPRTIGSTVTIAGEEIEMSAEEQAALRVRYSEAIPSIESLVGSSAYASLSDEQKESAVRFVYDVYYDTGISELYGYERNLKRRLFSKVISPEKLALASAMTAGLESDYEDERGRTISLEKWATVKGTTARVNYSTVSGSKRKKVIAAINKLPLTTAEKLLIIAYKGYTIKDGDIRGVSAARAKQMLSRYARGQGLSADEAKALEGYL